VGILGDWFGWMGRAPGASDDAPEPSIRFSTDIPTPIDSAIAATQRPEYQFEQPVTKRMALSADVVLRGRNLLCSFSTLPMHVRDGKGKRVENNLLKQIDPNTPNVVTMAGTVEDLVFEGYAWWRCTAWDSAGFPTSAEKLDANTVTMNPPSDHAKGLRTLPSEQKLPVGTVYVEGVPTPVRDSLGRPVLIRFDSPNPGVLRAAARSIRHLLLLQNSGVRYADNTRAQDYFTPDPNADPLSKTDIVELLDAWHKARKTNTTGYVPGSMELKQVDVLSPVELQLIDILKNAIIGVANAMGLDAEDLNVSTTSRTYQNGVDRRQDRINDVFSMYMSAITDRLSMNDVTRRGHAVSFFLNNYLKADPATRWACHKIAVEIGAMDIAEVREVEGLDPNPELERRAKEQRTAAQKPPAAPDELAPRRAKVAATAPVSAAFSRVNGMETETDDVTLTFAVDDDDAELFSADLDKRTITGLMVPWGKVNSGTFAKWRFGKDSLKWTDTTRIKLNLDHDRRNAVGYAQKVWSTSRGLMGTFKIGRGDEGDKALINAEDKVKDGFSIEVSFPAGAESWSITEAGDDFVRDVHNGQLTGCALTAAPSFDDARLTSVRASRNERTGPMADEDKNKGGGVGTLELSETAAAAFSTAVTAGVTAATEAMGAQFEAFQESLKDLIEAQQRPEAVDPATGKRVAQFEVKEAPCYRFDGIRGDHDFSSDLVAAHKNKDYEALNRAQKFLGEYFSDREYNRRVAEFAVTTSNVASINPSINRPDMYVDQLQYPTPIWDAIKKGSIADNTPFVLPKFNTSSGLVGDHVQGTEPTPGALTTTSQTITPSAVSGKVEITREAWDQGGNPQLSTILWRQMVRAWDEALEQGAASLLEGLTVATITLTDGAEDDVLVDEVTGAIVDLHFIRGGFRFQDFFLEKGLYKKLSQAKDADGRKLLPILGPQNADGSAGPLMASLNVAGLAGRPAWALPYTTNVESDSYIFNREDVHGWASAPQRLDFEYRVAFVDIAIWGYKAFACTRTDGVRKFAYDDNAGA
jgi:phage head maturation protease